MGPIVLSRPDPVNNQDERKPFVMTQCGIATEEALQRRTSNRMRKAHFKTTL